MSHDPNAHARGRSEPIELESRAVGQTHAIGRAIAGLCRSGDVVALEGDLGAGKTQLVRGLATGLGLDPDEVSSPTFVFVHEYEPAAPAGPRVGDRVGLTLVHVDAYRVTGAEDLASVGFDLEDPAFRTGCVVAIEWPGRLGLPPDRHLTLRIAHTLRGRRIAVAAGYDWADRQAPLRGALAPHHPDRATREPASP